MLKVVHSSMKRDQDLYLKPFPDLDAKGVKDIVTVSRDHRVTGFTVTNTTTNHDSRFILDSPGKGGASGNAVYDESLKVQRLMPKNAGMAMN